MQYQVCLLLGSRPLTQCKFRGSTSCSVNCVCRHFAHPRQCCFHGIPGALIRHLVVPSAPWNIQRQIDHLRVCRGGHRYHYRFNMSSFFSLGSSLFLSFPLSVLLLCRSCRWGNSIEQDINMARNQLHDQWQGDSAKRVLTLDK